MNINYSVIEHASSGLNIFVDPSLAIKEYRTYRKGVFGWLADEFVKQLPKESKDEDVMSAVMTGQDKAGNALPPNTMYRDKITMTLLGINVYNNVRFSEKYKANDYYEVIGFNPDYEPDEQGFTQLMSFIMPINRWDDPIHELTSKLLANAFKTYFATHKTATGFNGSPEMVRALVRTVEFNITRRKTNYGVVGFVQPTLVPADLVSAVGEELVMSWLEANDYVVPTNPRYQAAATDEGETLYDQTAF